MFDLAQAIPGVRDRVLSREGVKTAQRPGTLALAWVIPAQFVHQHLLPLQPQSRQLDHL